jgi:hypothetical protein
MNTRQMLDAHDLPKTAALEIEFERVRDGIARRCGRPSHGLLRLQWESNRTLGFWSINLPTLAVS